MGAGKDFVDQFLDRGERRSGTWIPALDGWRAVAVAAVVFDHLNGAPGWAVGNLGVAVFFSITGFLAYYMLWRDEKRSGQISWKYWLRRRVFRIWPAYFFVILVAYLFTYPVTDGLIGLVTFTENIDMATGRSWPLPVLAPLWSIAVEEHFYLLAPFMYRLLRSRYAAAFCLIVIVASNVLRQIWIAYWIPQCRNCGLYYFTFTYADTFVVGAMIARVYLDGWRPGKALQTWAVILLVPALALIARAWGTSIIPPYPAFAALAYAVVPLAGALAVVSALGDNVAARTLSSPPFQLIGGLSYSIYLVHVAPINFVASFTPDVLTLNVGAVVLILFFASALYKGPELYFLRRRHKPPPDATGPIPLVLSIVLVLVGLAWTAGRAIVG